MDPADAAEPLPQASVSRADQIRRLDALAAPVRGRLRVAGGCTVVAGWLLIAQAALIALLVQRGLVEGAAPASLAPALLALVAVGLARAALLLGARRTADAAGTTLRASLRRTLAVRVLGRGAPWLRRQRSGALSELTGTHVDALDGYFGGYLLARLEVMLVPLAMLVVALLVEPVVGVLLLVTMPLAPVFMMLVGWGAQAASQRQLRALSRMGGHFADRLRGLGLIRLYGRGNAELAGIEGAAEGLRERSLKVLRIAFLSSTVLEFFASVSVAVIALYLGMSYLGMIDLRGGAPLTLGTGLFLLLLAPEFYAPMRRLAAHYHDRASALAALEEIEHALADDVEPASSAALQADEPIRSTSLAPAASTTAPAVTLQGISVRHAGAGRDALSALDLEIAPGEFVALAGGSGSGKSTLLEAIAGWLPLREGRIVIAPPDARIGYAPQRPYLFHGSIADNLRIARPDADDASLQAAAEAAQVMRFATRLPGGLDTVIGERGFGLSGGEARRIALARLFLRDPALALLDEPTAFLDPDTERAVLEALVAFARGRTLIVATHSDAALEAAGRVVKLHAAGGLQ
ncbi:thiol reductant ABC exporter subunit CydD [Luteimonas sp. MHLX1A]|uniref:thiol reductant ABC exporter subunit CydD n=1 Tax=Alterluteimonas muca TaxID=2878684 RepID=UPI001E2BDA7B|nr:thiol reductant ABC exporter subunit CydD [Luteimonas sp. MHLX1A]MCD9047005.1 thiol reductant ABC exporter subunit CydD [Luteimonas sp. MHLX1A]